MKELGTYMDGDEDIILKETALSYQLYKEFLEKSLDDTINEKAQSRYHMQSMRFLKAVRDDLKQSGIGPLQRKKLNVNDDSNKEDTIFDQITDMLDD